jgi:protease YdgD
MVLTAAHCVHKISTQYKFPPGSLHFLIGYDRGLYAAHAVGVKIKTGPGYDPGRPSETLGSDWALITLDTRLGSADRILPIIGEPADVGSTVMLGGYQQDHPLILMADTKCRIVGRFVDATGRQLLRHNCTGTGGVSGAPLLISKAGKWYVAGMISPQRKASPQDSPSSPTRSEATFDRPAPVPPTRKVDISSAFLR